MKLRYLLLMLALAAVPARGMSITATVETPMQQAREVVVLLVSEDPGVGSSCSAVIISRNVAMTSAHCMDLPQPALRRQDGSVYPVVSFSLNTPKDTAILVVPRIGCPCAERTLEPARIDEPAYVVGFPYGIGSVLTTGHIQGRVTNPRDAQEYLLATASTAPGNSGGGLFVVREGKAYLVGIVSAKAPDGILTISVEVLP